MRALPMSNHVQLDADYRLLANHYRPLDEGHMTAEVLRLHQQGLTPRDLATMLQLPLEWCIHVTRRRYL